MVLCRGVSDNCMGVGVCAVPAWVLVSVLGIGIGAAAEVMGWVAGTGYGRFLLLAAPNCCSVIIFVVTYVVGYVFFLILKGG